MAERLSDRQAKMLDCIREYLDEYGYPPSIREIGLATGISSTSVVSYNLRALEQQGYLIRNDKVSRGLRLAEEAELAEGEESMAAGISPRTGLFQVPMLGTIGAGTHIQPRANDWLEPALGMISLPPEMAGNPESVYALKVEGDSMIDALIADGDIVIMHYQQSANNGDFVAAWLPKREIMTLKEFHREPDRKRISLLPYNRHMEPIVVESDADIEIQGRVIAVIRQLV
jgi:repressor LexA